MRALERWRASLEGERALGHRWGVRFTLGLLAVTTVGTLVNVLRGW